jgi:hypothetical protein
MTLGTAWNLWGPLTVHGASISANQNITVNKPAADMLFKAKANVSTAASRTLTTTGGDLILWANADKVSGVAGNGGRVYLASNTSLNSQGGGIYLGGGLDDGGADSGIPAMNGWSSMAAGDGLPDGFANGNNAASQNPGVWLDSGYSLSSNGGDIYIAGQDSTTNANSGTSANVIFHSGTVTWCVELWNLSARSNCRQRKRKIDLALGKPKRTRNHHLRRLEREHQSLCPRSYRFKLGSSKFAVGV